MAQHLKSTCLNVQTPMEWLWLPPEEVSPMPVCILTHTHIQVEPLGMKGLLIQNENDYII